MTKISLATVLALGFVSSLSAIEEHGLETIMVLVI